METIPVALPLVRCEFREDVREFEVYGVNFFVAVSRM